MNFSEKLDKALFENSEILIRELTGKIKRPKSKKYNYKLSFKEKKEKLSDPDTITASSALLAIDPETAKDPGTVDDLIDYIPPGTETTLIVSTEPKNPMTSVAEEQGWIRAIINLKRDEEGVLARVVTSHYAGEECLSGPEDKLVSISLDEIGGMINSRFQEWVDFLGEEEIESNPLYQAHRRSSEELQDQDEDDDPADWWKK
jgi:hypothetical protein